jgi:tRNA U34 5-methylaminomethyl-2-thiouridine-forming methyltransferase MnmC
MSETEIFTPQLTGDGSFTFFSAEFGEAFHSHFGARQEAREKFAIPTQLAEKSSNPILRIVDVCYGLGYNTASALETIWAVNPKCRVEWVGLEFNAAVPKAAIAHHLFESCRSPIPQILAQLATPQAGDRLANGDNFQGKLLIGDARQTIQEVIQSNFLADAIFLDPFSPPNCPQLWTVEFLQFLTYCLKPTGRLATYSCSAAVRTALMAAGLQIGSTPPVGRRSPGTIASFTAIDLPPLSPQEREHLHTRAAIPYRDPQLSDTAEAIRQRRQTEQEVSTLEPTSRWKKRWANLTRKPIGDRSAARGRSEEG